MKINLYEYGKELVYWLDAFRPFVVKESANALTGLQEQLENGRDNLRPSFPWKLPKPVMTVVADRYDGEGRSPHMVQVAWQFEAEFRSDASSRKSGIWSVEKMITQIRVHSTDGGGVISHFHFDMKAKKQLGPHIHLQVSESFQKDKGLIPLAVPRFSITPLLPTDCLDLVLSEFFPFDWPKAQSESSGRRQLQSRQQERLDRMLDAMASRRRDSLNTPIVEAQRWYAPDLRLA